MRWVVGVGLAVLFASAALGAADHEPPRRSAAVNYALHCQGCHLPDGSGMAGKVPDMRGVLGRYLQIPGGRNYIVQVPGNANARLSDRESAELLNWLVHKMGPDTPRFEPFTAQEVGPLRRNWLKQPLAVRTDLMAKLDGDAELQPAPIGSAATNPPH